MLLRLHFVRVLFAVVCLAIGAAGRAQWWDFGKTDEPVSFRYIYVNGFSVEEIGPKMTIYRDLLPNGELRIEGRVMVKRGKAGLVRVSTDAKESWKDAKLGEKGVFQFAFRPELGKTYELFIEATDTAGNTNPVDQTKTVIQVAEYDAREAIRRVLQKMAQAYIDEDRREFMKHVDRDFLGDYGFLERAVGKDFSAFEQLQLTFTLDNVSTTRNRKVGAFIQYNRSLVSTKTGANFKDAARTQFQFSLGEDEPKCYAMSNPLIFGLSDAENVATGGTTGTGNTQVITINNGNVNLVNLGDLNSGGGGSSQTGTAFLTVNETDPDPAQWFFESFTFEDATKDRQNRTEFGNLIGDFGVIGTSFSLAIRGGVQFQILTGYTSIAEIRTLPSTGWGSHALFPLYNEGITFIAFKLPGNKYAVIEITDMDQTAGRFRFKYKFSASGPSL